MVDCVKGALQLACGSVSRWSRQNDKSRQQRAALASCTSHSSFAYLEWPLTPSCTLLNIWATVSSGFFPLFLTMLAIYTAVCMNLCVTSPDTEQLSEALSLGCKSSYRSPQQHEESNALLLSRYFEDNRFPWQGLAEPTALGVFWGPSGCLFENSQRL